MGDFIKKLSARTFKTGCQPYSRIGHRAVLRGSNILVIGGTNYHNEVVTEILNINCESYEVSLIITKNTVPIESFSLHEYDNKIYLWGGKRTSGGHNFISNELWKLQNGLFSKLTQKGHIPPPRFGHCSVIFAKKYMVIYGGLSETQVLNDWFVLDLQTYEWAKVQSKSNLPQNLEPKLVWLLTRGIILVSQLWNNKNSKIQYSCDLYEFKMKKKGKQFEVLIDKIEIQFKKPITFRGFPTICKYTNDSLSLAIIGGQKFQEENNSVDFKMFSDCWMVNLDTNECQKAQSVQLTSKYGHEAIFYKDRILLIGGVCSANQFSSSLETIDFNLKEISIDRKLCQSCKCIYGLEDYTKHKISIKCEYESHPRSYVPAKLVKKFAEVIGNPIKAFGLFIDNSLNMNANFIELQFKKIKLDQRFYKDPFEQILEITDNSYGFNKQEIIESLFTFGFEIETFTHDSKFEEELAVRKQYGLNLKLASMRLGKSCLIVANTIEQQKFVGYFSINPTHSPQFQNRFNCFYYFINIQKAISSEINRHIIKKNVEHILRIEDLEELPETTNKIIVFDFNYKKQLTYSDDENTNIYCEAFEDEVSIFQNLNDYLKRLYLKPYFGRSINIGKHRVECDSLLQSFKNEESKGNLQKIDLQKCIDQTKLFELIILYQVMDKEYNYKKVFVYSQNRLITSLDLSSQKMCGVIELKSDFEISIGKCSIESQMEERKLKKFLIQLKDQVNPKRRFESLKDSQGKSVKTLSKITKKRKDK